MDHISAHTALTNQGLHEITFFLGAVYEARLLAKDGLLHRCIWGSYASYVTSLHVYAKQKFWCRGGQCRL